MLNMIRLGIQTQCLPFWQPARPQIAAHQGQGGTGCSTVTKQHLACKLTARRE